jgi:C4-type Zn-finger protein
MRDCPECGGEVVIEQVPSLYKGKMLYENMWICQSCDYREDLEPDWDSMKGGKDHE